MLFLLDLLTTRGASGLTPKPEWALMGVGSAGGVLAFGAARPSVLGPAGDLARPRGFVSPAAGPCRKRAAKIERGIGFAGGSGDA